MNTRPRTLTTLAATATWASTRESNTGETGTVPVQLETSKQLRIGQYQTVVTEVR